MFARRTVRAFLVLLTCFVVQMVIGPVSAQVPDDLSASLTGQGHAPLIGVSKYENDAWPELSSVTADIEDLAKGLARHFTTIEMLINPTTDNIQSKLREFMTGRWNRPDERLLVYYADPGFTDYNNNSRIYTAY